MGDTLKLKIPINGKGPFTFKVKKDDQPLDDNNRVRIQEYDDYILVTIPGLSISYSIFVFYNLKILFIFYRCRSR